MRGLQNFFIVFALTVTVKLAEAKPVDSTTNEDHKEFKCDGHEMRTENRTANEMILKKCLDKHGPATTLQSDATDSDKEKEMNRQISEIKNNNNTCFIVCILQEEKLFDDKGALTTASSDSFAETIFTTKESGNKIKAELTKCASKHGQKFSMDGKCVTYNDYLECVGKAFNEMCKIDTKSTAGK